MIYYIHRVKEQQTTKENNTMNFLTFMAVAILGALIYNMVLHGWD